MRYTSNREVTIADSNTVAVVDGKPMPCSHVQKHTHTPRAPSEVFDSALSPSNLKSVKDMFTQNGNISLLLSLSKEEIKTT